MSNCFSSCFLYASVGAILFTNGAIYSAIWIHWVKLNRRGPDQESREFCGKILPIDKEWKNNEITSCRQECYSSSFSHIDYTQTRTLQLCFVSPNKIRIQWCNNEILEIELPSKIIYKASCSPSADLCCSMLSLVSGCNLVASIASFICIISKQWSFRFGRTVHGHRFTRSHSFITKDFREFRSGQKGRGHRVCRWL